MAISKDFLWNTVARLVDELERVDPQSIVAARTRGLMDARALGLHTTDRHLKNGAAAGQDDLVAELYMGGKSVLTIAAEIGRSSNFVDACLERRGVKKRKPGPAQHVAAVLSNVPRVERIRAMRAEGKTLEEIGTELRITRERVRQLCVKNGISAERGLTAEQKQAVAEYVAGESLEQVAARYGSAPSTLRGWVAKEGYAIRPSPKISRRDPETLERAKRAAELYRSDKTVAEISQELGYGANGGPAVYRLLAIAGVKPDRGAFGHSQQQTEQVSA